MPLWGSARHILWTRPPRWSDYWRVRLSKNLSQDPVRAVLAAHKISRCSNDFALLSYCLLEPLGPAGLSQMRFRWAKSNSLGHALCHRNAGITDEFPTLPQLFATAIPAVPDAAG